MRVHRGCSCAHAERVVAIQYYKPNDFLCAPLLKRAPTQWYYPMMTLLLSLYCAQVMQLPTVAQYFAAILMLTRYGKLTVYLGGPAGRTTHQTAKHQQQRQQRRQQQRQHWQLQQLPPPATAAKGTRRAKYR